MITLCRTLTASEKLMAEGNVFVVWEGKGGSVSRMWQEHGWTVAHTLDTSVDLVQFTGGGDINPALYGQHPHSTTHFDLARDLHEYKAYRRAKELGIPMAGICRGAQLLHAFMGGQLWQDIDCHDEGEHEIRDEETGEIFITNSLHHQCCMENFEGGMKVLARAKEAKRLERMSLKDVNSKFPVTTIRPDVKDWFEVEAFLYEDARILGIQGHPEYGCSNLMLPIHYIIWVEEYILK